MCGVYECSPAEINYRTGLPVVEIREIAKKLQQDKKIFSQGSWVCLINHRKYQQYGGGDQIKAYNREIALIPQCFWNAMEQWDTSLYTSLYTAVTLMGRLDRIQNTEYRNQNTELINKKSEGVASRYKKYEEDEKTDKLVRDFEAFSEKQDLDS